MGPILSYRTFTFLIVTRLETMPSGRRQGWIVSVPFDPSGDKALETLDRDAGVFVRGRYVSIERLTELENGKTEWRCVSLSLFLAASLLF